MFDGPRLQPEDPYLRAKMRVFCKMADEYGLPATRVPTWTRTKTEQLKATDDAAFDKIIEDTPLIDHQLKMKALRAGGFSEREFEEAYGKMQYCYDRVEAALAEGPYVAGPEFSLGDIAILPYLDAFRGPRPDLMESHPRVKEWYERVMARPATRATYEPSDEAPAYRQRAA